MTRPKKNNRGTRKSARSLKEHRGPSSTNKNGAKSAKRKAASKHSDRLDPDFQASTEMESGEYDPVNSSAPYSATQSHQEASGEEDQSAKKGHSYVAGSNTERTALN